MRIVSSQTSIAYVKLDTIEIGSTFKYGGTPYIKMACITVDSYGEEENVLNAFDPAKGVAVYFNPATMVYDINTYAFVENYRNQ